MRILSPINYQILQFYQKKYLIKKKGEKHTRSVSSVSNNIWSDVKSRRNVAIRGKTFRGNCETKEERGKREEKAEREPSENDAFLGDVRGTRAWKMNLINVAWTKEVEARSRHNGDKKEWAAEIRELKTGRGARARARASQVDDDDDDGVRFL